jgi:hypothetical protein
MTIKFSDGRVAEALLLSRGENTIRLQAKGADDVLELSNIRGTWATADCEPVSIEFAWQCDDRAPVVSESDCVCSPELADRLLQLLFTDSCDDAPRDSRSIAARCS